MDPAVISILEYVKCWKYIIVLILQIRLVFSPSFDKSMLADLILLESGVVFQYYLKFVRNYVLVCTKKYVLMYSRTVRNLADFSWYLNLQSIPVFLTPWGWTFSKSFTENSPSTSTHSRWFNFVSEKKWFRFMEIRPQNSVQATFRITFHIARLYRL